MHFSNRADRRIYCLNIYVCVARRFAITRVLYCICRWSLLVAKSAESRLFTRSRARPRRQRRIYSYIYFSVKYWVGCMVCKCRYILWYVCASANMVVVARATWRHRATTIEINALFTTRRYSAHMAPSMHTWVRIVKIFIFVYQRFNMRTVQVRDGAFYR